MENEEQNNIECITLDDDHQMAEKEVITGAVVLNNKGFLVIEPEGYSVNQSEIKCSFTPKAGI